MLYLVKLLSHENQSGELDLPKFDKREREREREKERQTEKKTERQKDCRPTERWLEEKNNSQKMVKIKD